MSYSVSRLRVPIVIAIALLAAPALAGCSVQTLIRDVSGGKVDVPSKSVPKDFPSEVPLASGEVLTGAGVGDGTSKIWNVSVRAKDNTAIDSVSTTLSSAGFTCTTLTPTTKAGGALACDKGNFNVAVVEITDASGFVLNYTVTKGSGK
ncbi:MAG: hypothetical protein V4531_09950 [Actinomycetota bacterium]